MNKNTIALTLVSLVFIFGFLIGAYYFTNKPAQDDTKVYEETAKVQEDDNVKWATDSANILVEYSDLQCPACKAFHDYISSNIEATQEGKTDLTKDIKFVYRHFPLTIHQHAEISAYAAEAAGNQNKFFEMADALFDNQGQWSTSDDPKKEFETYAKDLELDVEKFKADMNSDEVKDRVKKDQQTGFGAGVDATPTFYLNGKKLTNFRSFEDFKKLLEDAVKE